MNLMKTFRPLLYLAGFVLLVGLACGTVVVEESPASPQQPAQPSAPDALPTLPPLPTASPTDIPVEPPPVEGDSGDAPAYFFEEFEGQLENWWYFLMSGSDANLGIYNESGNLVFDIPDENTWAYLMYDPWVYEDVYIQTTAENRGVNTNSISLICRYNEQGWYEFNVTNGGLWSILAYDVTDGYENLFNGGSTAIQSGRSFNEYIAVCQGNDLSLFINGEFIHKVTDTRYSFREGRVGVSVSSFDAIPVRVEFNNLIVDQP